MGGAVFDAMDDDAIMTIVQAWRKAHPRTRSLWYDREAAAREAINNLGESFGVRGLITFDVKADTQGIAWLRMRLPSGRYLCYPGPEIVEEVCPKCHGGGEILYPYAEREVLMKCPECGGTGHIGKGQITYMGIDQYTRQWKRLETYYGKIVENWDQAVSRDVFFSGLRRAMDAGFKVVLRVHDELVCEVPKGSGLTHEKLAGLMATNDAWNTGLPLSAAGFTTDRYRKE
jgi:DNA polymerase